MTELKQYTHPKDFKSHKVLIDQKDFSALTVSFEIFQDLFSPYWTAQIVISDTQNRIMFDKITQGSLVDIWLEDRLKKEHFQFVIYKMSDRQLVKQQHYTYVFDLINVAFIKDQKTRISKYYDDKKASDFAKEMLNEIGGVGTITATNGTYSFIVPNMSPMAATQWAAKWSEVPDAGADILVYQSNHKSWSFQSLEKMFGTPSRVLNKLIQKPQNLKNDDKTEPEDYYITMEQYKFVNHVDAIPNVIRGAFANTTLVHDMKNKVASTVTYNYGQDNEADASKKPFKRFDGITNANISYQPVISSNIEEDKKTFSEDHEKWRGSRKSNMMKLDTNRLIVSIPGRIDIFDQLGKAVYVELPSQQDIDISKWYDDYYKGNYVITAMRHIWTQKSYETFIELGKKRLDKSL